jgi:hypothetical protein
LASAWSAPQKFFWRALPLLVCPAEVLLEGSAGVGSRIGDISPISGAITELAKIRPFHQEICGAITELARSLPFHQKICGAITELAKDQCLPCEGFFGGALGGFFAVVGLSWPAIGARTISRVSPLARTR